MLLLASSTCATSAQGTGFCFLARLSDLIMAIIIIHYIINIVILIDISVPAKIPWLPAAESLSGPLRLPASRTSYHPCGFVRFSFQPSESATALNP